MAKYMLLLRGDPAASASLSPAQMQERMAAYSAWARSLGERGKMAGGDKLTDGPGKIVRNDGKGVTVKDGPYSETREVIGGYFMIEAADDAEAVAIARECPQVSGPGSVEVRRLDPM